MSGRRGRERWHDGGFSHREHHVGYQLPSLAAEEGLAERGQSHHQSVHVPAQATLLDDHAR